MYEVVGVEEEIRAGVLEGGGSIWKRTEPEERLDMVENLAVSIRWRVGGKMKSNEQGEEGKQEREKGEKKERKRGWKVDE